MRDTMCMVRRCCLATLLTMSLSAQPKRHALVMGNDRYEGNNLRNARNDAQGVAAALTQLGYITTLALDVDRTSMYRTIETFDAMLRPGDTVVFYYAGHGVQVEGENYLVPTNFRVTDSADIMAQGYGLSTLLRKFIEHGATTELIILDACRNNPFTPVRGVSGGWAGMSTSAGTFLAFGTSPGATASDEPNEGHGLFTMSLLKYMSLPSLGIEQMFQQVRAEVIERSAGRQIPWTASSLIGSFHMIPAEDDSAPVLTGAYLPALRTEASMGGTRSEGSVVANNEEEAQGSRNAELLAAADAELRGLRFTQAISLLRQLLSLDPRCAIALRLLGVALHLAGQSREAIRVLDAAVDLNSGDGDALALRCLVVGHLDRAASTRDCERSLMVGGDNVKAHIGLSVNLYAEGRFEEAQDETDKALVSDPTAPAIYTLRGTIASVQNRGNKAQEEFLRATALALSTER